MNKLKQIYRAFSAKERRIFFLAAIVLVLVLLIGGVKVGLDMTMALPASGGEFIEGAVGQPVFVNPVLANSEVDRGLTRLLFSPLESLASQIIPQENGRVWKVRFKEGMLWSDDSKLTSDDVIFTIQKIQDEETRSPLEKDWRGVAVKRLSELEVQFDLASTPSQAFEYSLKNLYVLPKHIFKDTPAPNWRISDYNLQPVGSGPYRFLELEKGRDGFIDYYRLEANPRYPLEQPLIQKFNFKFFKENDGLVEAFNRGQVDGWGGSDAQDRETIKRPYEKISFHLPSYYAVFINQSKNVVLKELPVRKALSLLAPRKQLIEEVLGGRGQIQEGPILPYLIKEQEENTSSPSLGAAEILKLAGWENRSGDSNSNATDSFLRKTVKKNEVELEVNLTVPEVPILTKTAEILKKNWEAAGIKTNLLLKPLSEIQETVKNRDYEMILYGNTLDASMDFYSFWHSSERFDPGLNLSLYSNKKADALLQEMQQKLSLEEKKGDLEELERVISGEYPAVFLFSPDYLYVSRSDLKGVRGGNISEAADRFKEVGGWHIKTVRVFK